LTVNEIRHLFAQLVRKPSAAPATGPVAPTTPSTRLVRRRVRCYSGPYA
jgi:hypothetical protein